MIQLANALDDPAGGQYYPQHANALWASHNRQCLCPCILVPPKIMTCFIMFWSIPPAPPPPPPIIYIASFHSVPGQQSGGGFHTT